MNAFLPYFNQDIDPRRPRQAAARCITNCRFGPIPRVLRFGQNPTLHFAGITHPAFRMTTAFSHRFAPLHAVNCDIRARRRRNAIDAMDSNENFGRL